MTVETGPVGRAGCNRSNKENEGKAGLTFCFLYTPIPDNPIINFFNAENEDAAFDHIDEKWLDIINSNQVWWLMKVVRAI